MARLTNRQLDHMITKINEEIEAQFKRAFPRNMDPKPTFTLSELIHKIEDGTLQLKPGKTLVGLSSHVGYNAAAAIHYLFEIPEHPGVAQWQVEYDARKSYRDKLEAAGKHLEEKLLMEGSGALVELEAFTSTLKKVLVPMVFTMSLPVKAKKQAKKTASKPKRFIPV